MQSLVFWIYLLALFSLYNDIEDMMHSMLNVNQGASRSKCVSMPNAEKAQCTPKTSAWCKLLCFINWRLNYCHSTPSFSWHEQASMSQLPWHGAILKKGRSFALECTPKPLKLYIKLHQMMPCIHINHKKW